MGCCQKVGFPEMQETESGEGIKVSIIHGRLVHGIYQIFPNREILLREVKF